MTLRGSAPHLLAKERYLELVSRRVELPELGIVARDDVVALSGPVDSAVAIRAAVDAAYRAGARDVRNALFVRQSRD